MQVNTGIQNNIFFFIETNPKHILWKCNANVRIVLSHEAASGLTEIKIKIDAHNSYLCNRLLGVRQAWAGALHEYRMWVFLAYGFYYSDFTVFSYTFFIDGAAKMGADLHLPMRILSFSDVKLCYLHAFNIE